MYEEAGIDHFLLLAFRSIMENSPDMIFVKDLSLRYLGASHAFARMVGKKSGEDIIGRNDYDIFNQKLAEHYNEDDRKVLETEIPIVNYIEPLPDADGKNRYSSTSKYAIFDDNGKISGLYGYARDVTAQIELEEERENRELSRQMFEGVLEADITEHKILRVEGTVGSKILGLVRDGGFVTTIDAIAERLIHPDYAAEFRSFYDLNHLASNYETGTREFSHITYLISSGEDYRWMEFKSRMYFSRFSNTIRMTTVLDDLDEEIRDKERLKHKAETDALTGLYNRESVVDQINECLKESVADNHVLLFIDLDCFKQVNDQLGHLYGDKVLKRVAEKLQAIFGETEIVGRIGGDEFLVFLKNITSINDAENRAKKLFEISPFCPIKNHPELLVTCSVGASLYQGDGKTVDQLYREADRAMYSAKENGKNKLVFYQQI